MMLMCIGPNLTNCENAFSPVMTDRGICYALNAPKQSHVMKELPYLDMFNKVFDPIVDESFNKWNISSDEEFLIILDSHQTSTGCDLTFDIAFCN